MKSAYLFILFIAVSIFAVSFEAPMGKNHNRKGRTKGPSTSARAAEKTPAERLLELIRRSEEMSKSTAPTGDGGSPAPSEPPTGRSGTAMSNAILSIQNDDEGHQYSQEIVRLVAKIISDMVKLDKIREKLMKI